MDNSIELRPINHKIKPTLVGQVLKTDVNYKHFIKASLRGDIGGSIDNFYHCMQSMVDTMILLDIPLEFIVKAQLDHFNRLKNEGVEFKDE